MLRKGVAGVIYRMKGQDIEFLLLHRINPWVGWELPKGTIEEGEEEIEAMRREIEEETHIANVLDIKKIGRFKYGYPKGNYNGTIEQVYLVKVNDKEVRINKKEHNDYRWAGPEDATETLTHYDHKKAVKIATKYIKL